MTDEKKQGGKDQAGSDCCSQIFASCAEGGRPVRFLIRAVESGDDEDAESGACCGPGEEAGGESAGCCIEVKCVKC